jgi:CRP-like cAMP-binding protein
VIDIRVLERSGLIHGLCDVDRDEALYAFKLFALGPGEEILVEGENDRSLCLVLEGTLIATLSGTRVGRIGAGETIGEMAMFGSLDRRSASVSSETEVRMLLLDDEGLRYMRLRDNPVVQRLESQAMRTIAQRIRSADLRIGQLAEGEQVIERTGRGMLTRLAAGLGLAGRRPSTPEPRLSAVLRNTPGFATRDDAVLERLASRFHPVAVRDHENVINEGEYGEDAYIIAEGRMAVYRSVDEDRSERVALLGPGHVVGAVALADHAGRSATVRAVAPSWLLRISHTDYRALEADLGAEGRAFRRGMIDAMSAQLRLANEHIVRLSGRWGGL